MNFRRRRPRRQVRCVLCTPHRDGNRGSRFKRKELGERQAMAEEARRYSSGEEARL